MSDLTVDKAHITASFVVTPHTRPGNFARVEETFAPCCIVTDKDGVLAIHPRCTPEHRATRVAPRLRAVRR